MATPTARTAEEIRTTGNHEVVFPITSSTLPRAKPPGARHLVTSGDSGDVWAYHGLTDDGHFHGARRKPSEAAKKHARRRKAIARASKRKNR